MPSSLPEFQVIERKVAFDNRPIDLRGASWFGAEGPGRTPDGLWMHNASFYIRFLSEHGFNAVRLPLALDNIASNIGPHMSMIAAEPSWFGLSYLDVLSHVIELAADHGLLVLLDLHRLQSAKWPDDGVWHTTPGQSLKDMKDVWDTLQSRFCSSWNVLGADLLNEPHGATWHQWADAASDLGNHILSKCQRWLIFVEGVAHHGLQSSVGEFFCMHPAFHIMLLTPPTHAFLGLCMQLTSALVYTTSC